jgi:hypothetical protein
MATEWLLTRWLRDEKASSSVSVDAKRRHAVRTYDLSLTIPMETLDGSRGSSLPLPR